MITKSTTPLHPLPPLLASGQADNRNSSGVQKISTDAPRAAAEVCLSQSKSQRIRFVSLATRQKSITQTIGSPRSFHSLFKNFRWTPPLSAPPPKKRNGCDIANVIIFRQLTKQTEYIVTTEKSSAKAAARISDFRSHGNPTAPFGPFNKYDTSKTESGTPQHRHSNTPECPRPEDCRQTRPLRNQYRTLC